VLGSFHLALVTLDIFSPIWGERIGIEAATSLERVQAGLWLPYAILLICVGFHANVGLYRMAVKWGVLSRLGRSTLRNIERVILWSFLGVGFVILLVLAGVMPPPLAFLLGGN
jgi:fumarate reductase subunit C